MTTISREGVGMSVRRAVVALGALVLLAGCGGDPKPKVEPTPTSSPTTSPSPSESAKPMSAEDFVRDWVELSNQMQADGDTTSYRAASTACAECLDLADRVDKVYKTGGTIETDGWDLRRIVVNGHGALLDVDIYVYSAPVKVLHGSGRVETLPGGPAHFLLGIKRTSSSWVATSLGLYER